MAPMPSTKTVIRLTSVLPRPRPSRPTRSLATELAGSERRAIIWFKFNPIISLGTKTAQEHVADGHADWVLAHIEDLLNGVYA